MVNCARATIEAANVDAYRPGRMRPLIRALFGCLVSVSALCCSLALDPASEQCATNADCTGRGASFAQTQCVQHTCQASTSTDAASVDVPDADVDAGDPHADPLWCLGQGTYIVPDPSRRLTLTQRFIRQSDASPVKKGQAVIRLCSRSDLNCQEPRAVVDPDDQGYVHVDVEYGFTGYFEFTGDNFQSSLFVINPMQADSEGPALQALSPFTAGVLASALLNTNLEPTLAHSIMALEDCNQKRMAGVSLAASVVDAQGRSHVFYILNPGTPVPGGTETNDLGQGGYINLPPGVGTITGTYNARQEHVVHIDLPLRPGFFSYGLLRPIDFL